MWHKVKYILLIFMVLLLGSCKSKGNEMPITEGEDSVQNDEFDLSDIEESGELIVATLNGPESYFQYHGVNMGLQYLLAEQYANVRGMRIRVETAKDTLELLQLLQQSKVDIIAYELPIKLLEKQHFLCAGVKDDSLKVSWAVRNTAIELAGNLNNWYTPKVLQDELARINEIMTRPRIKHSTKIFPVGVGKDGKISPYDGLFQQHAFSLNCDWRLLAAQCAQESAFDTHAVSWAGARGLMQIMPSTAKQLGVSTEELFNAEKNIATSVRYMQILQKQFQDIRHPMERIKFVLAAYNGGSRHIRDAMALAEKHGKSSQSWDVVSYYVLHLSEPAYYKDPVVKNGYMIGSETYHYVNTIMQRWQGYRKGVKGRIVSAEPLGIKEVMPQKSKKSNRFTKNTEGVVMRSDSIFN